MRRPRTVEDLAQSVRAGAQPSYFFFWGHRASAGPGASNPARWRGRNLLGFALMDVRAALRGEPPKT
jgi:hypothetical protein